MQKKLAPRKYKIFIDAGLKAGCTRQTCEGWWRTFRDTGRVEETVYNYCINLLKVDARTKR